jgi:ribosome-associated protein
VGGGGLGGEAALGRGRARWNMAKVKEKKPTARQLAVEAARIAHDRHCSHIVVLDLRGISPVTDYFVISTGTSDVQMRSVADDVVQQAGRIGHRAFNVAGREAARWVLLDFVDVVVHILDDECRRYYDLELIWGDAPRVRWQRRRASPSRASGESKDEPAGGTEEEV